MEHLAQDLSNALEDAAEGCIDPNYPFENYGKWSMRRRTRSAGNLHAFNNISGHLFEDSSSTDSDMRQSGNMKHVSFHQSDSDDMSCVNFALARVMCDKNSTKVRHIMKQVLRGRYKKLGVNHHNLESDSVNENSPARPNLRRKRKLKRMSIDEAPVPPCGKRKRSHRLDLVDQHGRLPRIKPLHPSLVDKIEKFCQSSSSIEQGSLMETQSIDDCEFASESSISWSGGEGHDGDDELTDWAPSMETSSAFDSYNNPDADSREIRAGCRRLGDERPGFSISTGANERVAKFLQDTSKIELKVLGSETEKLSQLAKLYCLDLWVDGPNSSLLRKTSKTPCMQPTQRHHNSLSSAHKRIRTQDQLKL